MKDTVYWFTTCFTVFKRVTKSVSSRQYCKEWHFALPSRIVEHTHTHTMFTLNLGALLYSTWLYIRLPPFREPRTRSVTDPYRSSRALAKEPGSALRTFPNPHEDSPLLLPLPPPFTPNVVPPAPRAPPPLPPRIRGVETTSRHFVHAGRRSETGGDNRE